MVRRRPGLGRVCVRSSGFLLGRAPVGRPLSTDTEIWTGRSDRNRNYRNSLFRKCDMSTLPDLEGLAIFAKVAELRSFARAAEELKLSKATVSKAVTRLEARLGTRLFNRTSRRLALTDAGRTLARARRRHAGRGRGRRERGAVAIGQRRAGWCGSPRRCRSACSTWRRCCREFLAAYPEIAIDLHLSDATVDLIGEGFDAAMRIAALPDSSLMARKLCDMPAPSSGRARLSRSPWPADAIRCSSPNIPASAMPISSAARPGASARRGEVADGAAGRAAARQQWRCDAAEPDRGPGLRRAAATSSWAMRWPMAGWKWCCPTGSCRPAPCTGSRRPAAPGRSGWRCWRTSSPPSWARAANLPNSRRRGPRSGAGRWRLPRGPSSDCAGSLRPRPRTKRVEAVAHRFERGLRLRPSDSPARP